ncbi:OsmC family protein [Thermorudis peleae]|uniref:OsmC family protein n=1 Tax=Thermorudis peleae TaxID=1382356 RepID=UPI00057042D8|nr:OsmC family protein [Thermorudis peleae]
MARNGNGEQIKETFATLAEAIKANPLMAEGLMTVHTRWIGGTQVEGHVRNFPPMIIDEPPALGGQDTGPNPVELLLLALGACQEITYSVLAHQLGIQLDGVEIDLTGTLDLRGFLGLDPNIRPGFTKIEMRVRLQSPEPEERLRELAERVARVCPVEDMLTRPVPIATQLEITRPAVAAD